MPESWHTQEDRINELRSQLDRDTECIREVQDELNRVYELRDDLRAQLADRDAEIERLRADLVWAVRKGVMVGHDECVRPCVWFDVHRGVEYDGSDAGILAALRRAMEGEK